MLRLKMKILGMTWCVYEGIGYSARQARCALRPSLPLAAGALPKFESVCDTIFYLYSRSQTSLHGYINKKVLLRKTFKLWVEDGI